MPSQHDGILDSKDWEEIKQDWEIKTAWQPAWKSSAKDRWLSTTKKTLLKHVPSWLWPPGKDGPQTELRRTAYLDGLRGFAAFLVYWHHHELWAHDNKDLENAFGYDGNYFFSAFHGVRLFFTGGHLAVATFFVISGYVLSVKPMSLIQASDQERLGDNLASALFRRWIRLYLPCIATTLVYMTMWHFPGIWCAGSNPQPTWRGELWEWYAEFKNFSFVFRLGGEPWFTYNVHLWSIPVEFKGSIIVYTSALAFSRCGRNARLLCQLALMVYFLYIADGWYGTLFIAGMLLADLDLLAARDDLPRFIARLAPLKTWIFYHLFAFAIFLGGVPSETLDVLQLRKNRGWYWLSFLKPQAVFDYKWFYLCHGAVFLVAAIPRIPWLKRFFETRFCQYLGRISFALYLVHGPVCWSLGDRVYRAVGYGKSGLEGKAPWWNDRFPLPKTGPLGLEFAFLAPHIILLPVTLWLAEMVTKFFDEPSVRFAAWLYKKTLGKPVTV